MKNACMPDTGEILMKIIKIVNNNIVTSLDEQNREIIVMGRGLGFGRKPGMPIEDEKVEKVFRLNSAGENQKLVDIIQDIHCSGRSSSIIHLNSRWVCRA